MKDMGTNGCMWSHGGHRGSDEVQDPMEGAGSNGHMGSHWGFMESHRGCIGSHGGCMVSREGCIGSCEGCRGSHGMQDPTECAGSNGGPMRGAGFPGVQGQMNGVLWGRWGLMGCMGFHWRSPGPMGCWVPQMLSRWVQQGQEVLPGAAQIRWC